MTIHNEHLFIQNVIPCQGQLWMKLDLNTILCYSVSLNSIRKCTRSRDYSARFTATHRTVSVLQMRGDGYADVLPVLQVPDNKADAVPYERLPGNK